MLARRQRHLTKPLVSIGMRERGRARTLEAIRRAKRMEDPFCDISPERKKTLLIGLLAKPLVEPTDY
jgi:hypothetical protein